MSARPAPDPEAAPCTYYFPEVHLVYTQIADLEIEYGAELLRNDHGRVIGCRCDAARFEAFLRERLPGLRRWVVER